MDNFPYPTPFPAKIWGVSCGVHRSLMLESAESHVPKPIIRGIFFEEFQPIP